MKTKNSTLSNKIKSYSALAGSLIAVGTTAEGQVVYTDVSPDLTFNTGGIYNLDLNNDGITDFSLQQRSGTIYSFFTYNAVGVQPEKAINAVDTLGSAAAHAVGAGFSVDGTLNWVDSTAMAAQFPPTAAVLGADAPAAGYSLGNFLGQSGKFLPLRFDVSGTTYYGWVRLDVNSTATSFTVIDYAYFNMADGPSITGMTADGIAENALSGQVEITTAGDEIVVKYDNNHPVGNIIIRDVQGKTVATAVISGTETIVPKPDVTAGVYLISVENNSGAYTKRLVLTK